MATVAPGYSRWKLTKGERNSLGKGLLFISPWLIGFFGLLAYPIYYTIRISFTKYSGFGDAKWIGLQNYRDLLEDDVFWKAVYNTLYYTALAVPIGVVVALTLAIAMNQPMPEVRFYRALFYLPSIIPVFTLTQTFQILMSPTQGVFNRILIFFGFPNINWFGNPAYSKIGLVILAQYGAGGAAIIFLAGLKGIPQSLYEAAALDGASSWRRFWNVTIPLLTPVILYDLIIGISGGLQVFTQVYILGGNPAGGPANSTMTYVLYMYTNGFTYGKFGYAAAMAWILFVVTGILAALIFWSSKKWVNYDTV
jgi:multiple sugar transport system permease protein